MFLALAAEVVAAPPPITSPDWERKPNGDDLARYYPDGAAKQGLGGLATVACKVTNAGDLTACAIETEDPPGAGFGDAALKLAAFFKMKPLTKDGLPVAGGVVRVPIRFAIAPPAAPTGPSLENVAACYGQVANLAEKTPGAPKAWRATIIWRAKLQSVMGGSFSRPSEEEAVAAKARLAAADGTLAVSPGWDLAACLEAVPKP